MASSSNKTTSSLAFFLCLNLVFFSLVTAQTPPSNASPSPAPTAGICPRFGQIGACVNLLNGFFGVSIGNRPVTQCCSLIGGLVGIEAAVCLCTAVKTSILGIVNLDISIPVNVLLSRCNRTPPPGFKCA